jgi:phosphoribosylformimino-5-aminoimidazole carboxamide ribotide isomerase
MRILPVLDILRGQVVRGIAGRRSEYRPIVSTLTTSCEPCAVAQAFQQHFGFTQFYLADLDAISGQPPALDLLRRLKEAGFGLLVDAGIRQAQDARLVAAAGVQVVAGLETLAGPAVLTEIIQELGADRVLFSLDLKDGQPLGDLGHWRAATPWELVKQAIEDCGVLQMLVLDLARVGVGDGAGTEELCAKLAEHYPQVTLAAGGGVKDRTDLERLEQAGVKMALVASALHDGRLDKEALAPFPAY